MTFWETFTLVGLGATVLGVFLRFYAILNNRTLKAESEMTRQVLLEAIERMDRGHSKLLGRIAELIVSEGEKTRQAIKA